MDTTKKATAKVGDSVQGDLWSWYATLGESDGFSDSSFPGCQFRLKEHGTLDNYAVNIKVTGKPVWSGFSYHSRCVLEIVGDGEPSTFFGGQLYHKAT
ncbi:hypothetical protein LCGC14_0614530 [marine sediment metagenome]|uniref:Uncharacterized protein n=1 Tax=marine sediment metagenome TaxID=412755 RepID=A0A0F9UF20_9ZZZZ